MSPWSSCFLTSSTIHLFAYQYIFLEKAMAPHSSTLACKIPWMEEPGGLWSMGLLRVGHDWATSLSLFTFMHWRRKWQPTPVFLPRESQARGVGSWWADVYGVARSRTWLKWLSSSSSSNIFLSRPTNNLKEIERFLEIRIPDHLTCLLRNLHAGQDATVRTRHGTMNWLKIEKGVRQWCILSSCLFKLYAEYIMWNAGLDESQTGINIARRNSLRYADDTTLMAES